MHKKTREVPYYLKISAPVNRRLKEYFGADDLDEALGNYLVSFSLKRGKDFTRRELHDRLYYDEFGCLWRGAEDNIGQIETPALREATLAGYEFPDGGDPNRVAGLQAVRKRHPDRYLSVSIENHTLLERAFNLRGMAELMKDIFDHPEFVGELLDRILEYGWEIARQILDFDVDAVKINDDYGDQRGIMLGAERWRKLIKPRIASLCERIKKNRKDVDIILHSDGNITDIMPDIVEMGITAINPMQPEVMDILNLKRRFGDEVSFIGGMSTQETLPFGSADDVLAEARMLVRELGKEGGFILSPGIIVQEDVPMENILAFISMCKEQDFANN